MKPSLELSASVRGPGGQRFRLAPDARAAGDRPLDLSFTTEAGEGFNTGQVTFSRPYDQEFPDLSLLNELTVEGSAGIAYEGRIVGVPRSLGSGGPEVRIDCEGWMGHARQRPFTDLFIDRDLAQWEEISNPQKVRFYSVGFGPFVSGSADDGQMWFTIDRLAQAGATGTIAGAQYRAPFPIGRVHVNWMSVPGTPWYREVATSTDRAGSVGNQYTGGSGAGMVDFLPTNGPKNALVHYRFPGAHTGDGPWPASWTPVVFGQHSEMPVNGTTTDTFSVPLHNLIVMLCSQYAPRLDLSQIVPNTFPVPHAVWREPTTVHDAIKDLNAYSQWALGVYENRQMEYRPFDLSQHDWEVRAGQDGVEIETPGVTVEDAYNGVIVKWTDFSGSEQILTPDDTTELQDANPAIAANQWGDRAWINLDLSNQTSQDGAITQARLYLADLNRPKFPSTITVPGHIRDRTGAWQPAWKVRANQTISVRNHPNDAPRLITSTSWQGNQIQITTDNALNRWEAIAARLERARTAAGA